MPVRMISRIAVLVLTVLVSGCASMTQDLLEKGSVTIAIAPSDDIEYTYPHVTQEGVSLSISSRVTFADAREYREGAAHSDVVVVDAAGEALFVAYVPYSRAGAHKLDRNAHFSVSTRLLLPEGSTVSIGNHPGPISLH